MDLRAALAEHAPTAKVTEEEDGWSVELGGLPGHVGAGATLEEAVASALDAAEAWGWAAREAVRKSTPLSFESTRDALVMALAVDGYIDIEAMDAENDLYGDGGVYRALRIDKAAWSLHRFLVMEPAEIEKHRAEVLTRRNQEGRE